MAKRASALLNALTYLKQGERLNQGWTEESPRGRDWEQLYRNRWQHDKVVRSTHGVNCTGSCSWKIHVKDGIITWETQATDYPSLGPDFPEYEPRGCPRGASFSWYEYSPARVKYPYMRGTLLELWRQAKREHGDPVAAWTAIMADPLKKQAYKSRRGKGGLVRASWEEVVELIAAASIYTIKQYGPDRLVGFSPIPAMSMVSYAAGARFLSLAGGTILSFYDWYADLPIASPQIWGDQTDVPESADWYNTDYLIIWGSNLPMTRTPDAHFMTESRYKGTRVAAVAPDYAEYVKFADTWLPARAGTDAALAMAMTHVILQEFYVDHPTEYFLEYAKRFTDLPFLVRLTPKGEAYASDRFLHLADLGGTAAKGEWKTMVWDQVAGRPTCPNGTIGSRWDDSGQWNLKLEDAQGNPVTPTLTFLGQQDATVPVDFPYFGGAKGDLVRRHVPVKSLRIGDEQVLVTTVFDLFAAHTGVGRGLPGDYPESYDDQRPYTPAWAEAITGVPRATAIQVAREFANTAARTRGRAMIAMGAGINHWYHSDVIYRAIINLVMLTGSQGRNGGGWAHYVGQEKVRPQEGFATLAFALDWNPGTRHQNGTSFFYFATDQFRYEEKAPVDLGWPGGGKFSAMHPADVNAMAARLGWLPFYPQFKENSLETVRKARAAGAVTDGEVAAHVAQRLVQGDLSFAVDKPDDVANFPRLMFVWRANLLTSSGKGHEYFLKHLLGTSGHVLTGPEHAWQPESIELDPLPENGKLDLLVDIDFRMTGTTLYSDIILPAATWYEKHDISSTDMHPFVHPFNPAINPPWEAKTDFDTFKAVAAKFTELAAQHLPAQEDLLMAPLNHDTAAEIAQPDGKVRDWRKGEIPAVPGQSMPRFVPVQRDYPHLYDQFIAIGPRAATAIAAKGLAVPSGDAYNHLKHQLGTVKRTGPAQDRPSIDQAVKFADAILALSGPTNGQRAVAGWKAMEKATGLTGLAEIAAGRADESMTVQELTVQPRTAIAAPVWSGLESHERRYSPFTSNVDFGLPWHTLTGRQHFYVDHEVMLDFGEGFPTYRPPLVMAPFPAGADAPAENGRQVVVRYITPHNKWSIHSTYGDTGPMLTLFRGGQTIWLSVEDAATIGVKDNDWVEVYNQNGVIACRAVVSHRVPAGLSIMYHAQDRHVGVPGTAITKDRGGAHNSVTRLIPKPTHMIGGYAQLSYGFNYYGPTGHQRDAVTVIRPLREVRWLED
ncbi:MAG: nitrate reductase subunit alpha [Mycobacterium leprae]